MKDALQKGTKRFSEHVNAYRNETQRLASELQCVSSIWTDAQYQRLSKAVIEMVQCVTQAITAGDEMEQLFRRYASCSEEEFRS